MPDSPETIRIIKHIRLLCGIIAGMCVLGAAVAFGPTVVSLVRSGAIPLVFMLFVLGSIGLLLCLAVFGGRPPKDQASQSNQLTSPSDDPPA